MRAVRWVCLSLAAMLLAACGSSAAPSSRPSSPAGTTSPAPKSAAPASGASSAVKQDFQLTGSNRDQVLAAAARGEKEVDWFTSLAGPSVQAVAQAFQKAYPGIQVSVYRAPQTQLTTRLVQSAQAGKYAGDVIEMPVAYAMQLRSLGLIAPYYTPAARGLPAQYVVPASGTLDWAVTDRISYISFGYNTKLLPAADVPKTLADLTNPALRGHMAQSLHGNAFEWVGDVEQAMGTKAAAAYFQRMAQQHFKNQDISAVALMGLIAGGQVIASPAVALDHAKEQIAKGASVRWVPIEPVIANVGVTVLASHAVHPAAAALFADYVLGPKGQAILAHYDYASPTQPVSYKVWIPGAGETATQFQQQYKQWSSLYHKYFEP